MRRWFKSLLWGCLVFAGLPVASSVAGEAKKVVFAYSTIGPMATGVWMAKEIGAFEKYGIAADLIFITSGPVVVQALIGGDLHGGTAASNAVMNAILSGAPIIGVAGTCNQPYHRLWVRPEINRVEDLRGKALGVVRFGSVTDNLTRILLRRYGLEGAVTVRQSGGTEETSIAFQRGQIVGAVTAELRNGIPAKMLLRLVDLGVPYSMNLMPVSKEFYRRNPETVEGLVRAYTEGIAAMNLQKSRALSVIAKYSHLSDAKSIESHYQDSVTYLERLPRAEPEALATILEYVGKKGMPVETFVDNTIIDKMAREGFVEKLYRKN